MKLSRCDKALACGMWLRSLLLPTHSLGRAPCSLRITMAASGSSAQAGEAVGQASIFGSSVKVEKKVEKREKLKNIDTVAAKILDPWGVSAIDEVPLDCLWAIVKRGDKWCKFHSELASDGDYRVGIGLSRLCEIMTTVIEELTARVDLRKCLNPLVLAKADAEAAELLPHFATLNAGKASLAGLKEDSFCGLKRRKKEPQTSGLTASPGPAALAASSKKLCEWLSLGTASPLRMLIVFLSAGGVFFAAHVADKTARAWLTHQVPKVTEETVTRVISARHTEQPTFFFCAPHAC
jgi:hypothetical protein